MPREVYDRHRDLNLTVLPPNGHGQNTAEKKYIIEQVRIADIPPRLPLRFPGKFYQLFTEMLSELRRAPDDCAVVKWFDDMREAKGAVNSLRARAKRVFGEEVLIASLRLVDDQIGVYLQRGPNWPIDEG